ncbi:MAG: AAA family ATPase [Clostridiales bacterium]|nr:AAA family ATPase [Clostridiales bacterium]
MTMFIKNIYIGTFGPIQDKKFDFQNKINLIEGDNESGKSTICAFIKFMFFGLSAKSVSGLSAKGTSGLSDRKKYIPFESNCAFGTMTLHTGKDGGEGEDYLIERRITLTGKTAAKDEYRILSLATGQPAFVGIEPCDAFLSMSEGLFLRTVYVSQKMGAAVDGKEITAALENLLFSAEESVDSAKAIKELDAVRVELLYKNGKGGRLYEAQGKRDELLARLEQTKRARQELAAEEEQLRRLQKSESENQRLTTEAQQKIEQYNQATLLQSFDKLHRLEQKQAALQAKRAKLTPSGGLPETEEIHMAIRLASELRAAWQDLDRLQDAWQKCRKEEGTEGALAAFLGQKKTAARAKAAGFVVLLVGLAACIGGFVMTAGLLTEAVPAVLPYALWGCGGALFVASILLFAMGAKKSRTIKQFFAMSGAEQMEKIRLLEKQALAQAQRQNTAETEQQNTAKTDAALSQLLEKRAQAEALEDSAAQLCQKYRAAFSSPDSLDDLAVRLTAVKENCLSLESEWQQIEKAKEELRAALADEEEETLKQSLPAPAETILQTYNIKDLKNRLAFGTEAQESIRAKRSELETALAAKRAALADEGELAAEIEEQTALIDMLTLRYNAVKLALDRIEEASLRIKSNVSPALAGRASELMCAATKDKYAKLWIADDVSMTYQEPGGFMRSVDYLSQGTKDLAYIALRIALCETLCQDKQMPMIFDEAFAALDDHRLAQMLAVIAAREGQTLIFTSHTRDKAFLDDAHVISLS